MLINLQHDEAHCPLLNDDPENGIEHTHSITGTASIRRHGTVLLLGSGTKDSQHTFAGLPYLLMKGVYKDAFIVHEPSAQDPSMMKLKEKDPEKYKIFVRTYVREFCQNVSFFGVFLSPNTVLRCENVFRLSSSSI